ncbi:hypothetical protein RJ639_017128 [Escallonia herrerae]|uniref:Uncharacterized protein n=1 Tax=Escallonia herrerae TaxID=1293975 RepID=A0AA88VFA3_9ASTE|nr:hypothetical protein RJ639_017128 [Escallonia herrerae]
MGVSFMVSKAGKRYRQKPLVIDDKEDENGGQTENPRRDTEGNVAELGDRVANHSSTSGRSGSHFISADYEASFCLNLFPNGFSVGKGGEIPLGIKSRSKHSSFGQVEQKVALPVASASKGPHRDLIYEPHSIKSRLPGTFDTGMGQFELIEFLRNFGLVVSTLPVLQATGIYRRWLAIENGYLPGDTFGDIPCKYVDGAVLCEIRDYRNIFLEGNGSSSIEKSPIIYKVELQMCMESVVKDISSFSDASWTYSDLLEVESRILKVLRPVLHLNPKPMLNQFCEKTLTRKLDLGIAWSRKKRKVSSASATDLVFSNTVTGTNTAGVCPQSLLSGSGLEVPYSPERVQTPIPTSYENNLIQETPSDSFWLKYASAANNVLQETSRPIPAKKTSTVKQSISKALTPPYCVSAIKQRHSNCIFDPRIPSKCPFGEWESQGAPEQLPGSHTENNLASEVQWKNKLLEQRITANYLYESKDRTKHPTVSANSGQQVTLEGIPKLQAELATCRVKEEPVEFSELSSLDPGKVLDKSKMTEMRYNTSIQQLLRPSTLVRAAPTKAQLKHIGSNVSESMPNETLTEETKPLRTSQHSMALPDSCPGGSVQKGASVPTTRKPTSRLKGSFIKRVESLANTSNLKASGITCSELGTNSLATTTLSSVVDAACHQAGTSLPSAVTDPIVDRYGLNKRERNSSQLLEKRPLFRSTLLVAFHLDSRVSSSDAPNKLIIMEKLDEGMVEASAVYGHQALDPVDWPCLRTFSNRHDADLFAVQFTLLMAHEGYHLVCDQIDHVPPNIEGSSIMQQPTVTGSATPASGTFDLPPFRLFGDQSPYMLGPTSSTLSAIMPSQMLSQNSFFGGNLRPHENAQSVVLHLHAGYVSNNQHDITGQSSSLHQPWQQDFNKRASLKFQMIQRERVQHQLLQRKMMMGLGVGASHLNTVQPDGRVQGPGNVAHGRSNDILSVVGSTSMTMGGNILRTGNMLQNTTPAAVLERMRIAEGQRRALKGGFPLQSNVVNMPTCPPDISAMAYNAINQQPAQLQTQRRLGAIPQQQQETRFPLQHLEANSLPKHIGPPLSEVSHHHRNQQLHTSSQQLSPHDTEAGNVVVDRERLLYLLQ